MLGGTRHVTVTPRSLSLPVTLFRDLSHMCRPLSTNHYSVGTSINTTKTARHGLVCLCFKPFWLSEVTRTLRRRHVLGRSSPPLLNTPSNEQLGQRATGNWQLETLLHKHKWCVPRRSRPPPIPPGPTPPISRRGADERARCAGRRGARAGERASGRHVRRVPKCPRRQPRGRSGSTSRRVVAPSLAGRHERRAGFAHLSTEVPDEEEAACLRG